MKKELHKICFNCHRPFIAKSEKARYCSPGCRQQAYKKRHNIAPPDFLKDVLKTKILTPLEERTKAKIEALNELDLNIAKLRNIQPEEVRKNDLIRNCEHWIQMNNTSIFHGFKYQPLYYNKATTATVLADEKIRAVFARAYKQYHGKSFKYDLIGKRSEYFENNRRLPDGKVRRTLPLFGTLLQEIIDQELEVLKNRASQELATLLKDREDRVFELQQLQKGITVEKARNSGQMVDSKTITEQPRDSWFIYKSPYYEIFGEVSKSFVCMLHGRPSSGKSSFSIMLADYFQNHHGDVAYFSLEEGTAMTFQDKISSYAKGEKSFQISTEIRPDRISELSAAYDLVIIDSLQDKFKEEEIGIILSGSKINNTSFVLLQHQTKSGDYKGGSWLEHLVDIRLEAENGEIIVHKNRFSKYKLSEIPIPFFADEKRLKKE